MSQLPAGKNRLHLEGDWSMTGIADQYKSLSEQLALLPGSATDKERPLATAENQREIDLTGIDALDACGCQLLTVFLKNLKQKGFAPIWAAIPDPVRAKIHQLGFDHEFTTYLDVAEDRA